MELHTIQTVVNSLNRKTEVFLLLKKQVRLEIILLIHILGQQKHIATMFSEKKTQNYKVKKPLE